MKIGGKGKDYFTIQFYMMKNGSELILLIILKVSKNHDEFLTVFSLYITKYYTCLFGF